MSCAIVNRYSPGGTEIFESYHCPPGNCIANPKIQTVSSLPTGTSAPNTVITEHVVRALRLTLIPDGWLIQTAGTVPPTQADAARQLALTVPIARRNQIRFAGAVADNRPGHRGRHRPRARGAGHDRRPDPRRGRP